jgi:hypothetical protein
MQELANVQEVASLLQFQKILDRLATVPEPGGMTWASLTEVLTEDVSDALAVGT